MSRPAKNRLGHFYETDTALAQIVAGFLCEGLTNGSPGIVVATANQRTEIIRELSGRSVDVAALLRSHDLVFLDADSALSTCVIDGKPDAQKFRDHIYQTIESVRSGRPDCRVRIFGQMVDILWRRGERNAAIRLELLWNQLAKTAASSLVCRYAIGNFFKDASFEESCGQESVSSEGSANRVVAKALDSTRRRPKPRSR